MQQQRDRVEAEHAQRLSCLTGLCRLLAERLLDRVIDEAAAAGFQSTTIYVWADREDVTLFGPGPESTLLVLTKRQAWALRTAIEQRCAHAGHDLSQRPDPMRALFEARPGMLASSTWVWETATGSGQPICLGLRIEDSRGPDGDAREWKLTLDCAAPERGRGLTYIGGRSNAARDMLAAMVRAGAVVR